jgi:thioredoxin-like negative regulator of GroEL
MRMLRFIPILLCAASLGAAVNPPGEEPPPTPERKALDDLYELMRGKDAKAVKQTYEQVIKQFKGKEAADEATWTYASFLFQEGRLDKAQQLLQSLEKSGRANRWVSKAVLGLS